MPFDVSQSIEIDRPAHEVWPYLIAFEQVPLWEHGVVEVRQVTPGPAGVGTEVLARRVYAGRESLLRGYLTVFEDGRVATMSLRGGPFDGFTVAYTVEPIDDDRSRVTHRASGNLTGLLWLLHPVLVTIGRRETRKNLASLKRRIHAGIPARSDTPTPRAR